LREPPPRPLLPAAVAGRAPTRSVVVVFVTVMVAIVSGLDYLFTKAVLTVFG